jgi:hypothetical protein
MSAIAIEFSEQNEVFKSQLLDIIGGQVTDDFIKSKNLHGDIVNVLVTVIIPVAMPLIAVLFDKYLVKLDKAPSDDKSVNITWNGEEYMFKNHDLQDVSDFLKELKKME